MCEKCQTSSWGSRLEISGVLPVEISINMKFLNHEFFEDSKTVILITFGLILANIVFKVTKVFRKAQQIQLKRWLNLLLFWSFWRASIILISVRSMRCFKIFFKTTPRKQLKYREMIPLLILKT